MYHHTASEMSHHILHTRLRALTLLFEAERFRYFELVAEFQEGISQGAFLVILPEPVLPSEKPKDSPDAARMEDAVGNARADLNAVICRLKLSLSELLNLQVLQTKS